MNGRKVYSREELIDFIQRYTKEIGRIPERSDFIGIKDKDVPSVSQLIKLFGSFLKALQAAGFGNGKKFKRRLNQGICQYCGKPFEFYSTKSNTRKYCSVSCRSEHKKEEGIKHRNISRDRGTDRYSAFSVYGEKCERCGWEQPKGYYAIRHHRKSPTLLEVHHIKGSSISSLIEDLCVLCPICHAMATRGITEYSRDSSGNLYWEDLSVEEYNENQLFRLNERRKREREAMRNRRLKMRQSELHENEHEEIDRNDQSTQ